MFPAAGAGLLNAPILTCERTLEEDELELGETRRYLRSLHASIKEEVKIIIMANYTYNYNGIIDLSDIYCMLYEEFLNEAFI